MRLPPSLVILCGILHVESPVLFYGSNQRQIINCFTDQNNKKKMEI